MQNLSCENEFYLHENKKNHFNISGFALSLTLKQRLRAPRKWPVCHWGCARDWVGDASNRPLPSSKNPHFLNEARCTTFLVKMSFIWMRMKKPFPYRRLSTYPRFETEARGNSEMAYRTMKHGTESGTYFDPVSYAIFDNSKWNFKLSDSVPRAFPWCNSTQLRPSLERHNIKIGPY